MLQNTQGGGIKIITNKKSNPPRQNDRKNIVAQNNKNRMSSQKIKIDHSRALALRRYVF